MKNFPLICHVPKSCVAHDWHSFVRFRRDSVHQIEIHNLIESERDDVRGWQTTFVMLWTNFAFHPPPFLPFLFLIPHSSLCSSVHLCTASLHGSVTCMCHCWTGCMSTTLLNTRVASSCARTTAPTKLSSSRCEPSTLPCVKTVGVEAEKVEKKLDEREKRGWEERVKRKRGNRGEELTNLGCPERKVGSLRHSLGWQ